MLRRIATTTRTVRRPVITAAVTRLTPFFSTSSPAAKSDTDTDTDMPSSSSAGGYPVQKSDEEWRAILSPEQFRILRQQGTEPAHTGAYTTHSAPGTYACAGCSTPLYLSSHKFSSSCGWPAYFDAIPGRVIRREDNAWGMRRTEIMCANCGGHLGHVFKGEGYGTPTDERHCVNSVSLTFKGE